MKHRLVTKPDPIKIIEPPPFDGLRIVLAPAGGLTAITRNGFEAHIELSLAGLNRLHEMLVEQQRKKVVPSFTPIAAHCLAAWERIGPHGAGKIPRLPKGSRLPRIVDLAEIL